MKSDSRQNINSMKTNTEGNVLNTEKKVETASFLPANMKMPRGDDDDVD